MFDMTNYVFVHKSRKSKRGGGVGIYIKNSNKFKERTDLTIFEDGIFESIFIEIENINSVKTLIGVIYRPTNHANRDIFEEKMQIILQNITININPCYIVVDFNINLLNSETSANFLDLMSSYCFKPHISTPTRLNNEGNYTSSIDNIFSNTNNESYSGTISYDISDHLPIYYCAYNNSNNNNNDNIFNNQTTHARVLRNLSKTNINNFINKISKEKWTPIYDQNNPDNAYDSFLKIFLIHYNYCFPFLRKSQKFNIPKKDWCTFDIAKSCKTKCKLYKTFTQNPNDINKQNYITFRNKLNHTIRKAKQTYYYNIFKECDIKKHGFV